MELKSESVSYCPTVELLLPKCVRKFAQSSSRVSVSISRSAIPSRLLEITCLARSSIAA